MALDPNIALSVQPAKLPDPLTSIAGLMQLRGQMTDIALRQAQIETQRQNAANIDAEQQQKNRDLADQNTLQALEKDPATYAKLHSGDLTPLAGKVQPKTIEAVQQFVNDSLDKQATLDTTHLAQQKDAHAEIARTLDSFQQMKAADGSLDLDRINQSLPGAIQALTPQLKIAGIDATKLPKSIHSANELQLMASQAGALGAMTDAAIARKKTQAETAHAEAGAAESTAAADSAKAQADHIRATLPKDQADAAIAQLNSEFAAAHNGLNPDQFTQSQETKRHNLKTEANAAAETNIKQKTFDATFGAGLDANGQPLAPEAVKAAAEQDPTAVAIAHYQTAPPSPTLRNGAPNPMLRKVLAINPNYDGTQFQARNKVQQDFSAAGASGKIITAADTALAHLNAISEAGKALKNDDIQVLNKVANELGAQTGSSPKVVYDTIVSMVAPEISKAVIGESGGEGERAAMAHNFSSSTNDSTREGAIQSAANLLTQRLHKQAQAYESSMGTPLDLTKRLSPESQAIIGKYAGQPGSSIPHVRTKAEFDALPSGSIYTEDDGQRYRKP